MISRLKGRHFVSMTDFSGDEVRTLLDLAVSLKAECKAGQTQHRLAGRTLGMIFQKPSLRTRVSFEAGMTQLGGHAIYLAPADIKLGERESVEDIATVLGRYVDVIMARVFAHAHVVELAMHAGVPVINGLTCRSHPCQVMADVMTFEERKGPIKGRTIAWIGDANNVATSWVHAAARFGCKLRIAAPKAFAPPPTLLAWAAAEGASIEIGQDPLQAARGADCVMTDVWVSMGDNDAKKRTEAFAPFQVDGKVMGAARKDAIFMHCLPTHRGDEVTAEVIDGPQSAVWDEAENRLHVQKAILAWCLAGDASKTKRGTAKRAARKAKPRRAR